MPACLCIHLPAHLHGASTCACAGDDTIVGKHRVLVYLVPFSGPAGDKYADSAGGAVAVYDYSMTMTRLE